MRRCVAADWSSVLLARKATRAVARIQSAGVFSGFGPCVCVFVCLYVCVFNVSMFYFCIFEFLRKATGALERIKSAGVFFGFGPCVRCLCFSPCVCVCVFMKSHSSIGGNTKCQCIYGFVPVFVFVCLCFVCYLPEKPLERWSMCTFQFLDTVFVIVCLCVYEMPLDCWPEYKVPVYFPVLPPVFVFVFVCLCVVYL